MSNRSRVVRPKRHFAGKPLVEEEEDDEKEYGEEVELKVDDQTGDRKGEFRLESITLKKEKERDDHETKDDVSKASVTSAYEEYEVEEEDVDEEELQRQGIVIEEYGVETLNESADDKDTKPNIESGEESDSEESEESAGSDESDSDSESESEPDNVPLVRPVFIKKKSQSSGTSMSTAPQEKAGRTLDLIEMAIRHEQAEERAKYETDFKDLESVDDTDGLDPEGELDAWKQRELRRLRRERQQYIEQEKEQEEIERRRNLTEEQILEEDREKLEQQKQEKQRRREKRRYMQRHYHRGAFYQEDEILKRDFSELTEDDYRDRSVLPKALQVRGVGLKGQIRYKTLREEDTTLQSDDLRRKKR